jgi:hypothetical protein
MEISFEDHVWACEYMEEHDAKMTAWMEGPRIGEARFAYAKAHEAHQATIVTGNVDEIDAAWGVYCDARRAFQDIYYA